ncbi:MAG: hypothetical protein FJ218_08890, partial [Ignavibacteria bacterium]|nr:hypothetical protein [Ignavibacteria bacterium]
MKIKLSLGSNTLNAQQATHFMCESVDLSELKGKITEYNYSLITWKIDEQSKDDIFNRKRLSNNFESASGIVVDIDEGITVEEARVRLRNERLNHVIITSKSHQKVKGDSPACDRFHILLFFDTETTSAEKYKAAYQKLLGIFPEMDTSVKDLARFIFASPTDAEYWEYFDGKFIAVNELEEISDEERSAISSRNIFDFSPEQIVTLSSGEQVKIIDIEGKHPCHCIRPEHPDKHPSAFVQYVAEKDKHMFYCSACGWTGWCSVTRFEYMLSMKMRDFYF